tara:strand:+ start:1811 stop:2425 length:615 start_codon:yes stop_codon:yes gene_type:complete
MILVLDYNVGNVNSVIRAAKLFASDVIFSNKKEDIVSAKKIIMPGQGSFDFAMNNINKLNIYNIIRETVIEKKTPILGICLGMQILATSGNENSYCKGLDLISGRVEKLNCSEKYLPHIGWNSIFFEKKNNLFNGIENETDYYFLHSYHFICENNENIQATCNYQNKFNAIIQKDNVLGIQFHPEKSLNNGLILLKNFIKDDER